MSSHKLNNGDKILINNRVYTVVAVLYKCIYVKHAPLCTDYDFTENEIIQNYKIEFINQKEK